MNLKIDRDETTTLRDQIAGAIRHRIQIGELHEGARIPSTREMAELLGVNRATVMLSYADLKDGRWIECGVGRGTYVAYDHPASPATGTLRAVPSPACPPWSELVRHGTRLTSERQETAAKSTGGKGNGPAPLARAVAHPELFPVDAVREATEKTLRGQGARLLDYGSPAGHEPLRELLRERLAARGIDMERNDVLVVNGSQQGIDLAARLLLVRGSRVVTSRPSFYGALSIFRWHEAECLGVPIDGEGLDAAALEYVVRRKRPRLAYTIPYCHNPTGVVASEARLEALLAVARRHRLPILEDDWLGELRELGDPGPLKARDTTGNVLYLGTMSKALFPGLRIGWMVLPDEVFGSFLELKSSSDLSTNLPGQAVLAELLASGEVDRHLERVRASFRRRRDLAVKAMEQHFPAETRPIEPHAGMACWIELPERIDVARVVEQARLAGVEIGDCRLFDPAGRGLPGFRLVHSRVEEAELEPAIARLGGVLTRALDTPTHPGQPLV